MNETPQDRKSHAGKGNRNALRHGLKAGKMPDDCAYLEIRLNSLRRTLEDAVLAAYGGVDETRAAIILRAIDWERHRTLCQRWMRLKGKNLPLSDLLRLSEGMAKGSTELSKAIEALGLERDAKEDLMEKLYSR